MVKKALYILISGLSLLVFSACDSGLKIVEISISKYPDRISYFCGQDNEIDLTGLEITVRSADGNSYIASPADDDFYGFFSVIYDVDFNSSGVYLVHFERAGLTCQFPIEVLSESR